MPQIPSFGSSESYGQPQAPPAERGVPLNAFSGASDALAAGMADVSRSFSELWAHQQAASAATQAVQAGTDVHMKYADLQEKYQNDPDPETAPARYKVEAEQLRTDALQNLSPAVAAHVDRNVIARVMPAGYAEVSRVSHSRYIGDRTAALSDALGGQAKLLATASNANDAEASVASIKQGIAGGVESGFYRAGDANALFSNAIKQSVLIAGATDPAAAQNLLDAHKDEMTAADVALLQNHLREPLFRTQKAGMANQANQPGAIDPETQTRAQAVHDAFVEKGYPEAAAWGLAANAVQESGANPNPQPGDGGRSTGLFQWNGSRRDSFTAKYGVDPGNATLAQQVDFADTEMRTSEAGAGDAIKAAATPADAARIASTRYLRPADTVNEEPRRAGIAAQLASGVPVTPTRPTLAGAIAKAGTLAADLPPEQRLAVQQEAATVWHLQDQAYVVERANATRAAQDLSAAYGQGMTDAPVPEDRIRTAFAGQPEQAEGMITDLKLQRQAGNAYMSVQWASPAEKQALLASYAVPPSASADDIHRHLAVYGKLAQMIATSDRQLAQDPAAYVAASPELRAKAQAMQGAADPVAAFGDYAQAATALQSKLGVAPLQQRLLTNEAVDSTVSTLTHTDPSKADIGAVLAQQGQIYGKDWWPQVYGELVRVGKLPPEYQTLAIMPNAADRNQFQRALQAGGIKTLTEAAGSAAVQDIDKNLSASIDKFRTTAAIPGLSLNAGLIDTMTNSTKMLALSYAAGGMNSTDALAQATAAVFGKYDFAGTMRVPKGRLLEVQQAADQTQAGLEANDMWPHASGAGLTEGQRQRITLRNAQKGVWVTNEQDDGLYLAAKDADGAYVLMHRNDGSRIELKFNALPPPKPMDVPATLVQFE